jgi:multicomponent Na+:H+ antiporter subunit F
VIVGAIALVAVRTGSTTFIDVVLIATLLGFLATVALAALVGRGDS